MVMNDRSQGASAGLRGNKNIEIMHHRRYRKANESKSYNDPLNDLTEDGRGVAVSATYYLQLSNVATKDEKPIKQW